MLSCDCSDYDGEGWYYRKPSDFTLLQTKRKRRCSSCKELISLGSVCLEFERFRDPLTDIEDRIWGDEVQLANYYLCEPCGEIFLNLEDLGYCLDITENMNECFEEYWELTGFKPPKN